MDECLRASSFSSSVSPARKPHFIALQTLPCYNGHKDPEEVLVAIESKLITYEDYLLLPELNRRYEIIDGELQMTPSPTSAIRSLFSGLPRCWNRLSPNETSAKCYLPPW